MKKLISILLTLSMLVSFACFTQASAVDAVNQGGFNLGVLDGEQELGNALENFNPDSITASSNDVFALLEKGAFDSVDTLFTWSAENSNFDSEVDYVVDFFYNSKAELAWGNQVLDENGASIKGDVALTSANINAHLKRILNNKYGGQNLYLKNSNPSVKDADDYASAIATFIYNLINPTGGEYKKISIVFPGTETVSEDTFYGTIVEKSGLDDVLQYNWCNQSKINFKPVLYVIGIDFDDILDSEYLDGFRLGKKIVRYVIEKFLNAGPINYFLDLAWAYSRAYNASLYEPTMALLNMKIADRLSNTDKEAMTVEDLQTLTGLVNLIFNNFDSTDTSKLQFMTLPVRRIGMAKDTTEVFLVLLTYLNLNSRVGNNAQLLKNKSALTAIFGSDTVGAAFYDSVFLAEYKTNDGNPSTIEGFIDSYTAMYQDAIDHAPRDIIESVKRTLQKILKFIADYFDNLFKILTGEKQFGQ